MSDMMHAFAGICEIEELEAVVAPSGAAALGVF